MNLLKWFKPDPETATSLLYDESRFFQAFCFCAMIDVVRSKRKFWLILFVLFIPYIFYSITLFDAFLNYYFSFKNEIFSLPLYYLLAPIGYLFGNPEGLGLSLIITNIMYPLYSFLVLLLSLLFTWKLYQKEKKIYFRYAVVSIAIIILPILVTAINSNLSYASHKNETALILENHSNLTVTTYKASFTENEVTLPIEIQGLEPENQPYLVEVLLSDKDTGNLGGVRLQAEYIDNRWHFKSQVNDSEAEQDGNRVVIKFMVSSNRYSQDNLRILVDIHQGFNLFYSEWFDI